MIYELNGFPEYKYDDVKGVVLSSYEKNKKGELKWSIVQGKKRITLWSNKNPYYKFENQILKMIGQTIQRNNKKIIEKEVFEDEVNENDIEDQMRKEFDQKKWNEVEKFLKDRNKPLRRDIFQNKFGKDNLESFLDNNLLEESKIGNFKFYNIKN